MVRTEDRNHYKLALAYWNYCSYSIQARKLEKTA